MRKGYVLAFKGDIHRIPDGHDGDKDFWGNHCLREKGVWVNFERDLIMLDVLWQNDMPNDWPLEPLRLLSMFAPDDVNRIRRLGLGGAKGAPVRVWGIERYRDQHLHFKGWAYKWFRAAGWLNLREIWVDDDFQDADPEESTWLPVLR